MPSSRDDSIDLRSIFLGPKAENADVFERLLLEALRDHIFWRRNVHPEDGFLVLEADKRTPAYERSISVLAQELLGLLGELKAGVPFFSPRYIGHMTADLSMAALVAYFATMLYNPNNVAAEASPVTTRMESEAAQQLGAMIGYPTDRLWGHLCSGGTVANLEALWVARNLKYLPVALRWTAEELGAEDLPVRLPTGETAPLGELDLWALLNLEPADALDAADRLHALIGDPERLAEGLDHASLSGLGYQEFGRRIAAAFGDPLPPGVVLVASTAHYSWEKTCRVLGVGSAQLVHVPVDRRFRMDVQALADTLAGLRARRQPVIAVVPVIGSTEESAVDPLADIVELRRAMAAEGMAFVLHADAAWGGYAAAITRAGDGSRRPHAAVLAELAPETWPDEEVYRALVALEATDSVTIDPHKMGYVPYPAGAVLFRDARVRALVAVEAPYLFHRGASEWGAIGRFILEGSKPGAAAAAVWMAHKVLPLDERGYGRLIAETARGARLLHRRLCAGDWAPFRLVPLPAPDLNIVGFALGHPALPTLDATNAFVDRVYRAMSVGHGRPARQLDYFVTKTFLRAAAYGRAAMPLVEALGFTEADYRHAGGLGVIRCTVADPFLGSPPWRDLHLEGFARTLRQVLDAELADMLAAS